MEPKRKNVHVEGKIEIERVLDENGDAVFLVRIEKAKSTHGDWVMLTTELVIGETEFMPAVEAFTVEGNHSTKRYVRKNAFGRAELMSETEGKNFSDDGLEHQVLVCIQSILNGSRLGVQREKIGSLGEVDYVLTKDVMAAVNRELGISEAGGLTAMTISQICRSLGFRYVRTAAGWAVVVEEQDLKAAASRFLPRQEA